MIKLEEIDVTDVNEQVWGFIDTAMGIVKDDLHFGTHPSDELEHYKLALKVAKLLQAEHHFWLSHGKGIE